MAGADEAFADLECLLHPDLRSPAAAVPETLKQWKEAVEAREYWVLLAQEDAMAKSVQLVSQEDFLKQRARELERRQLELDRLAAQLSQKKADLEAREKRILEHESVLCEQREQMHVAMGKLHDREDYLAWRWKQQTHRELGGRFAGSFLVECMGVWGGHTGVC